jgi:hypothetical protein
VVVMVGRSQFWDGAGTRSSPFLKSVLGLDEAVKLVDEVLPDVVQFILFDLDS